MTFPILLKKCCMRSNRHAQLRMIGVSFSLYCALSFGLSLWSSYDKKTNVAFGYDTSVGTEELFIGILLITLANLCFILGFTFALYVKNLHYITRTPSIRITNAERLGLFVPGITLVLYYIFRDFTGFEKLDGELSRRQFDFKEFRLLMIIFLLIIYKTLHNMYGFFLLTCLTLVFAYTDASRFAIFIQCLTFALYYQVVPRLLSMLSIIIIVVAFAYSRFGDGLQLNLTTILNYGYFLLSYVSEFNVYHFSYTFSSKSGTFNFSDFIFSITPIPSSLHPIAADDRLWRIDTYRPLSGQGGVARLSVPLFIFYNLIFGFIAGRIIKSIPSTLLPIFTLVILAIFAISFQYSIRLTTWYLTGAYLFSRIFIIHTGTPSTRLALKHRKYPPPP